MKELIKLPALKYQKWILVCLILISFGASIGNQYSFDDELVTTENNEKVNKGIAGVYEILTTPYSSAFNDKDKFEYRPVTQLTFAFEKSIFGFKPAVSHLINLILYCSICLILFKITTKLLEEYPKWVPFLICFIFAIHPLHSEVVLSLKNREELLVSWCGFLSLWFLMQFLTTKKWKYTLFTICLISLGINSKTSFIPFIYVIPFVLYFFKYLNLKKALLSLGLIAIVSSLALYIPRSFIDLDLSRETIYFENPLFYFSTIERLPTAFHTFLYYFQMHLFPYPLISYYGFSQFELKNWGNIAPYLGILLLVFSIIMFFVSYKKNKLIALGIMLYLLFVAPFQNFPFPVTGIVAERFTFNSVFAYGILLTGIIYFLVEKFNTQKYILFFLSVLTLTFVSMNVVRTKDWKTLVTLLQVDTVKATKSAKLQMMYGDVLLVEIQKTSDQKIKNEYLNQAIHSYKKAIEIYPEYSGTQVNLGVAYSMKGDISRAIIHLKKGIDLGDENPENIYNLGVCYEMSKDTMNALNYYKIASDKYDFPLAEERLKTIGKQVVIQKKVP